MNRDQRRFLIIALIVSFMAASDRIVRFYVNNAPLASVGECIEINLPARPQPTIGKILSNDFEKGYCVIQTADDLPEEVSYADLRYFDAKKVDCEKGN